MVSNVQSRVGGIFLLLCMRAVFSIKCPLICKCVWELDSLIVDCSKRGLTKYPILEKGLPVERLDLSHNRFRVFPTEYANIESLLHVDLSNNLIDELTEQALLGYESLRTLILANNSFRSWSDISPNAVFQHTPNLQVLSLAKNDFQDASDKEDSLQLISNLLDLDLQSCKMTQFINLSGMPHIEKLNMAGNNLMVIPALESKSLRVLDLSNCSLVRLGPSFLSGLTELEDLIMPWNSALALGSRLGGTFESYKLRRIDISFCNLDIVDLRGMPNLEVALLAGNMLHTVSDTLFANNTLLEVLNLSRNAIRHIDPVAFAHLRKLSLLDLSYNEIIRIDRNQFRNNDALVTINLSRNIFNQFTKFISNSLRILNLSWCEIISIEPNVFTGFKTLFTLDLSNNLITELPTGLSSLTLKNLDLSMCRLSIIRNTTFAGFPELASLKLSGNRFTNPLSRDDFKLNQYLNQIWLGDNLWRCDCYDRTLHSFYEYLTEKPQKIRDKYNLKCFSPSEYYGKSWESACMNVWFPVYNQRSAEKTWTIIIVILLILGCGWLFFSLLQRIIRNRINKRERRERQENEAELELIRRYNRRILDQEAQPNAPTSLQTALPSYEDAILMPKLNRISKSMMDLTGTRKRSQPDRNRGIEGDESLVDHHRFRSEEMLANRDKERTAPFGTFRRTEKLTQKHSGSRKFSIEDSRFPSSYLKSQNLQSAEKIANFQNYEHSPYAKRRPNLPEPAVFKRASVRDSVEFLTDSEYNSRKCSPFAQRKPLSSSSASLSAISASKIPTDTCLYAVEEHFGCNVDTRSTSTSSSSSGFQIMRKSDVDVASVSDADDPIVIVHPPMRESKL